MQHALKAQYRTHLSTIPALKRNARVIARTVAPAVLALVAVAHAQTTGGSSGEITQSQFTDLATKILTYLGYAIAAGLTVLVAVLAAMAGWRFFGKFIKA